MQTVKKNNGETISVSTVSEGTFVPELSQVIAPAIIADVFQDQPIPFAVNGDGSVDAPTFANWLSEIGNEALAALHDCSEIVTPGDDGVTVFPFRAGLPA